MLSQLNTILVNYYMLHVFFPVLCVENGFCVCCMLCNFVSSGCILQFSILWLVLFFVGIVMGFMPFC